MVIAHIDEQEHGKDHKYRIANETLRLFAKHFAHQKPDLMWDFIEVLESFDPIFEEK